MNSTDYIKLYARIGGIFVVFLLAFVFVLSIGRCNRNNGPGSEIIVQVDTLYLHDTVRIEKPFPQFIKTIDTLLVQITDTLRIKDTVYLNLPREQKTYREENFHAWVSGYRPALDSIHLFQNTQQIITSTTIRQKPNKPKRWGIGIQAGYGFTCQQNTIQPVPYIGIGLNYTLLFF
ncbi:MAG: DUF6808 domain-containing protein [Bacteroidales bacterium]|jgi:hypothetical protein